MPPEPGLLEYPPRERSRTLRILLQCPYYAPEVGGLESHVRDLSEELARRRHDVSVVTGRSRPGLSSDEMVAGVRVRRVWMPARTPAGWIAHVGASVPVHARMARDVDVYHAHTFASVVPPLLERRLKSRPLVVTLHTSHFLMRAERPLWRRVMKRLIREADHLLATSEEIKDVALEIYPHPRAEAITNPVNTERFAPAPPGLRSGRRRIIVPRRLFPKNGVEFFVRSLPQIVESIDAEAHIVGDGPEREKLEKLAGELGVADRIEFMGSRSHEEMPELLRRSDLAVIPSLMEATSIAALEAMSTGVPVAASNVGGLPEIIDEAVGGLFQPGDPASLASAVSALLQRPDLSALGAEGRRRVVENWSLGRMVDRHEEIYRELIAEFSDPPASPD